jgi:hypothetical protein
MRRLKKWVQWHCLTSLLAIAGTLLFSFNF